MKSPQINEAEWLERLSWLPDWHPPAVPTLVIAPHPDDETLAAGGLIARLRAQDVKVTVAAVTDGEMAYPGESGLGGMREQEQAAALERLGVAEKEVLRLRLPDSSVTAFEDALVARLRPYVTRETHLVAPWTRDFHPDHEACGRVAVRLAEKTGARLTFWFFWTWHHATPALLDGLALRSFALTVDELHAKSKALLCHQSQLEHASGKPILPDDLLGPARRPFEVYLPL